MTGIEDQAIDPRTMTTTELHVQPFTGDHDQVISLPVYEGRYNTDAYFDWEFEVDNIFGCHDFNEHEKVRIAAQTFIDLASVWWDWNYKENIDNTPTTWVDLKSVLRRKFVPLSHQRELLRKLEQLEQGTNTVHVYYQEFKFYMYRCDIKEFEESTRNMFFNGLNPDIKVMFKYIPRTTIGIYVRACAFEKHIYETTLDHSGAFNSCTLALVVSSNIPHMNIVV
jgi:hypothetical protein